MNIKFINVNKTNSNYIYELIKENIYKCSIVSKPVFDTKYHHQTPIKKVPDVLKNGLLSKRKSAELEGRKLTQKEILSYSDESRVNGLDYISLSSMDIDFSEMSEDDFCYNPFNVVGVDIVISKDVEVHRSTHNYFNEFLVRDKIPSEMFNAIDLRILKILDFDFHDVDKNKMDSRIELMVDYYNELRNIALSLKENKLSIPLREVSNDIITLNPQKVIAFPRIQLK